jgi:hypothetical protein
MCDEGGYLIFIPDENRPKNDPITVTLKLKYYVTCPKKDGKGDYKVEYNYTNRVDITTDIAILKEGHMHNLLLTFTASGVYLKAQVSQDWTEKEIHHEFD